MKLYLSIFLIIGVFIIGYLTGRAATDPVLVSETKYVDRLTPPTAKYAHSFATTVYLPMPVIKTRIDTVRVPKEIIRYVLTDPKKAISTTPTKVSFTYFDPATQRYNTEWYLTPKKTYYFTAEAEYTYLFSTKQHNARLTGGFHRKNIGIIGGLQFTQIGLTPFVGLRYNIIGY